VTTRGIADLSGKRAFVTGSGTPGAMGATIAAVLARQGAHVALGDLLSTESLPVAEFLRRRTEDRIVLARRSCVRISNEVPAHAPTIMVLRSAAVEEVELADADGVTLS